MRLILTSRTFNMRFGEVIMSGYWRLRGSMIQVMSCGVILVWRMSGGGTWRGGGFVVLRIRGIEVRYVKGGEAMDGQRRMQGRYYD